MAEPVSLLKGIRKKKDLATSRSFLHCAATPLSEVNSGRLSLMSTARLQKITSNSLEKLSFVSEKEGSDNSDYENYLLAYSGYLLSKAQNRVLVKNKKEREENIKKCFVSLKLEFEGLLEKYVKLSKEIGYYKIYLEIIKECESKIEVGKNILGMLRENQFESLLKSLSNSLDCMVNQLQLVDIDKASVEEVFNRGVWGSGSEIDVCLKKIDSCAMKNKTQVSNIAVELTEIRKLGLDNAELRQRFISLFDKHSNKILDANYTCYTEVMKKAFQKREESKEECITNTQGFDVLEFLQFGLRPLNTVGNQHNSLQLSHLESPYLVRPKSASTPQPE